MCITFFLDVTLVLTNVGPLAGMQLSNVVRLVGIFLS